MTSLSDAFPAPRELIYAATFSASQRAIIARSPDLAAAIFAADPARWPDILARHAMARQIPAAINPHSCGGMRRQAIDDLNSAVKAYGQLSDGRRAELFKSICRLAKYVANGVLQHAEVMMAFSEAAAANGAAAKHGQRWVQDTVSRAITLGRNDPLPPLHRRYASPKKSAAGGRP